MITSLEEFSIDAIQRRRSIRNNLRSWPNCAGLFLSLQISKDPYLTSSKQLLQFCAHETSFITRIAKNTTFMLRFSSSSQVNLESFYNSCLYFFLLSNQPFKSLSHLPNGNFFLFFIRSGNCTELQKEKWNNKLVDESVQILQNIKL